MMRTDLKSIPFDICVLTAANEVQAHGYDQHILWRRHQPLLAQTDVKVIADPDGKRIGSGGSTFYVLSELYAEYGEALLSKRTLILHSGGDSRRLPAYSAVGKLFMPLPTDDHRTLFDVMIENYATLPNPGGGQVIIASGDVLLNFDPTFIDFSPTGITGVAFPDNPSEGEFFGVYVVDNPQTSCVPAVDILQKPGLDELAEHGAIDVSNRIWIDSGILHLAPDAVKTWLRCQELMDAARRGEINVNLYHDILYAAHGKLDMADADVLAESSVYVNCLPYCGFYHIGKSTDVLQNFYALTHASVRYHFQNGVRSNAAQVPELKSAWIYNSLIESKRVSVHSPCLLEGCFIDGDLSLAGDNIVTNVPQGTGAFVLSKGLCLNVLPLKDDRWVAVLYGLNDTFKNPYTTFLNMPFIEMVHEKNIVDAELWEGEDRDIWTARLFPCSKSPANAVASVLELQHNDDIRQWRTSERLSMADILRSVDHNRLLHNHADIRAKSQFLTLSHHIEDSDFCFSELQHCIHTEEEKKSAIVQLETVLKKSHDHLLLKARTLFWLAQLHEPEHAEARFEASFAAIRQAVAAGFSDLSKKSGMDSFGIRSDEVVWTMLPARLDFAGGWTDTPPVCLERGGHVLNASVTLNGQYPIQVIGKIIPNTFSIGINSIDLGQRTTIYSFDELRRFNNPADWLSLPKAAFYAAGIFDDRATDLQSILKKFGGGIDLTLFSALPAGSGLGTSSILGAGIIATISRMMGVTLSRDELYARTSNLEQLMTTGGGWQDQIGGIAGGVKLISTHPGYDQTPQLAWTTLKQPGMDIGDFYLLYYTGIRRMAKNLLRQVVGRYLNRDAGALDALTQLSQLAVDMKDDLDHRRLESFGGKIHTAWTLNTSLDAGQTTPDIDHVLARIDDYIFGAKLLGAGGGGFLFIAAKDKEATRRIRQELADNPPNNRARFFDFDIDPGGMRISVL